LKALREEFDALLAWLREPTLWAALLLALLAWSLAYQWHYAPRLAVGGDVEARTRRFDEPYLRGFNASEPAGITQPDGTRVEWWELAAPPDAFAYRWAESQAGVHMPGLGGGPWLLTLGLSSGRPDQSSVTTVLRAGRDEYLLVVPAGRPRRFSLPLRALPGGNLELTLETPRLQAPGDPRDLGLLVNAVLLAPQPMGLRAPAWAMLGWLGLTLLLSYGLLRRLALSRGWALLGLLAIALVAAGLLAWARLPLVVFAPQLPGLLLACYILAVLGLRLPLLGRAAVLLVVLGFALRLGGMLHPHVIFSDLGLNTNNLRSIVRGELFISEGLPAEAGGGQAPYPPGQYVALAPLLLAFGTDGAGLDLATQAFNALLDAGVAGLIWLALRRVGYGASTAVFGAALYLLPPPLLRSFSIGEFANIYGQAVAMALLLLALAAPQAPRVFPLAVLLALAALGHLGVSISLACLLAVLLLLLLLSGGARLLVTRRLIVAGLLAGAFVVAVYYSAYADLLRERAMASSGGQPGPTEDVLARLVGRMRRELRVGGLLYPPLVALGLLGLLLSQEGTGKKGHARGNRQAARGGGGVGLALLLAAWWAGTLCSLGLLLFARQGVRWEHFLYPALALGGGTALGRLRRRGRAGRALALGLLAAILWYAGALWYNQLRTYLH
jgi:hypothetical protein